MAVQSVTTRRAAFGMAAVLPLAGIAAAPSRSPSPDVGLIAMCGEYLANDEEYLRVEEPYWHQPGYEACPSPTDQATLTALIERNRELFDLIADTQATTDHGRRAVARVCRSLIAFDLDGNLRDDGDAVLLSLLNSLVGEARA